MHEKALNPKKIAILWTKSSGYSAACWKKLNAHRCVRPKIFLGMSNLIESDAPFIDSEQLKGLDYCIAGDSESFNYIGQQMLAFDPDAILVAGWSIKSYRKIVVDRRFSRAVKIMAMDNPWRNSWKQYVTCLIRKRYVNNFDYVWVPGERARQFALRISNKPIVRTGLYSIDLDVVVESDANDISHLGDYFLFIGRYVESKNLRLLIEAYREYRRRCNNPWRLVCCGAGPLKELLKAEPGVVDMNFLQPNHLVNVIRKSKVFVLPSRYEPWGVVVLEAMASGVPVIASDACGSSVELIRDYFNGLVFSRNSSKELADCMLWFHENCSCIRDMSTNCLLISKAYSADVWAEKFLKMIELS